MLNKVKKQDVRYTKMSISALFLLYTIVDTFPEIEKIRLHSSYYYQDKYGNPYSETVFISNTSRKVVNKINRYHFRPSMLKDLIDFYMSKKAVDDNELTGK